MYKRQPGIDIKDAKPKNEIEENFGYLLIRKCDYILPGEALLQSKCV